MSRTVTASERDVHAIAETAAGVMFDVPVARVRSPIDGIRTLVGACLVLVGAALANAFDSTMLGLASDTSASVDELPGWFRDLAGSVVASVVIVGSVTVAIWSLLTTRYRRFALYSAGIAAAAGASIVLGRLVYEIADDPVQQSFAIDVPLFRIAGWNGRLNPADPLLAVSIATLTIAASFLSVRVIRRASVAVVVYALASALTIAAPPLALLGDVGAGLFFGSLLLWIFGRHDVALRPTEIRRALASAGYDVVQVEPALGARDIDWIATQPTGEQLVVSAFSRDDRSSALITRATRWIRFRKTGDHRPFLSLRRSVEHQALVSLQARNRGIATPAIRAVASAGVDGMVLARDPAGGAEIAEPCAPVERSDAVLRSMWRQAAQLQSARIAHGRLRVTSFAVDAEGQSWLLGFERGELAATEQRLGTDLAELLTSTAATIGTPHAVRLAYDVIGPASLQRAIPWLQPLALTVATRDAIGGSDELEQVRSATIEICGLEPEESVRLERIDPKTAFVLGTIVLSAWFLLPQLADVGSLWSQARDASWGWALAAVLFSVGTYVAATGSLLGAIPVRIAFWQAVVAQVASSFANRVTPAKVGGFATNLRYLQRKGVPTAVGATAVGLNAIAGVIMHVVLTLCALLLASGDRRSGGIGVPSVGVIVLVLAALAMTVVAGVAIPSTRRLVSTHVLPQLRTGWDALRVIIHDPIRLLMLFGGATMITVCYLAAMVASLRAFDSNVSVPLAGLLFLTGSVVANAAPTPGGLGAAEAALIAALSTVEQTTIVVPAVFLFRLVTFWLPILPGWIAIAYLRRTDNL